MNEREASQLFDELYESLHPQLLRYAAHKTGSVALAEDVVQEVFMRLYRELRLGHEIESPRAWAFCVVRREIGHHQSRDGAFGVRAPIDCLDEAALARPPASGVVEADDVSRLLSFLSPREAEVLLLRLGNLKYREIGTELGISAKSVATLLARALTKLRAVLTAAHGGETATRYAETESAKPLQR